MASKASIGIFFFSSSSSSAAYPGLFFFSNILCTLLCFYFLHKKVQRMLKKNENCLCNKTLPHPQVFALPYVTMAHQSAPGCLQGLFENPSEDVSSCSKWTGLAKDCLPWPEHSSPVSGIQIIDLSDATFEERAPEEKRKGWEEEMGWGSCLNSRRLPTWLEWNSVSDLHIYSVRHALDCHLFHLSLTWECVCIPNGWRRGWATAPSDSEGSIRQVWLFLSSLSEGLQLLWFDESPGSLQCAASVALLPSCGRQTRKKFLCFVFSGSYLSAAVITYSSYVCRACFTHALNSCPYTFVLILRCPHDVFKPSCTWAIC